MLIRGSWIKGRRELYYFCHFCARKIPFFFFFLFIWCQKENSFLKISVPVPGGQNLPGFQGEGLDSQSNECFYRTHTFISYMFSGLGVNLQICKSIHKIDPVSLDL